MKDVKLDKLSIKNLILTYCDQKQVSQKELSTIIGVNSATISKIINDNWDNISDRQWKQIDNEVQKVLAINILTTTDVNNAFRLINSARTHKRMVGLVANTGMGKTAILEAFSTQPNAYYFYIDATITPKIFLKIMLQNCGIEFEGNINEMLQTLIAKINTIHDPIIMFDECAKMSDRLMLLIHSIRDRTKNNCGIILAGMPDFKTRLVKFANKGKTGYGEFLRRVNEWLELEGLSVKEINAILNSYEINDPIVQKSFRRYNRFGDLKNEIDNLLIQHQ